MCLFRSPGSENIFTAAVTPKRKSPLHARDELDDELDAPPTGHFHVSKGHSFGDINIPLSSTLLSTDEIDQNQKQELEQLLSKYSVNILKLF